MGNSFGDQFLKAGLVDKARLHEAKKSKSRKQKQKNKQKVEVADEAAEAARLAAADKAARDRELNRQRKAETERRAIQAQVRQLIELNRLARGEGEIPYHFQDGTVVKTIAVPEALRDKLARGLLAIVRFDGGYEVIPSVVADRIRQRDPSWIVSQAMTRREEGDDDPYADYRVPDDLMW
jgi:uncharacterized protein YaiL (DUF2058 family)